MLNTKYFILNPILPRFRFYRRCLIGALVIVLVVLIPTAAYLLRRPQSVSAGWWNDTWAYRQSVKIDGSGINLTDFQIKVTVNTAALITAGKMQTNCNDIRITNAGGVLLPHMIFSGCNTTTTSIWIKADSIASSGSVYLYLYYGNPTASSASDADAVFELYDDFDDGVIDTAKWTASTLGSGGSYAETGGQLQLTASNSLTGSASVKSIKTFTNNVVMEWRRYDTEQHYSDVSFGYGGLQGGATATDWWHTNFQYSYTNLLQDNTQSIYRRCDSASCTIIATIDGPDAVQWINHKNIYDSNGLWQWYYDTGAGYTLIGTGYTDTTYLTNSKNILLTRGGYSGAAYGGTAQYDYFFVRKYAATEPTVNAPSTEQNTLSPVAYYSFDEGNGTTIHNQMEKNSESGVVGWWKMDEGTGTAANDEMKMSNTAFYGSPTWGAGIRGSALTFNGSNTGLSATDPADGHLDFGAGQNFTVTGWFKTGTAPGAGAYPNIINKSQSGGVGGRTGYLVYTTNSGNKACFQVFVAGSGPNECSDVKGDITDNQWHFFAGVRNGTTHQFYLDGVLQSTQNGSAGDVSNAIDFNIGKQWDNVAANFFNGSIDSVKVYNRALTVGEIQVSYTSLEGNAIHNPAWVDGAQSSASQKPLGKALTFDGLNDYVTVPDALALNQNASNPYLSVSAWIYPTDGDGGYVITKSYSDNGWMLAWGSNGAMSFHPYYPNTGMAATAAGAAPANRWSHVVAVYDGSHSLIYINGQLAGSTDYSGGILANTEPLLIGAKNQWSPTVTGAMFQGKIDEVKVYRAALTVNQVLKEYNRGAGVVLGAGTKSTNPGSANLVGWWKMDEGSGNTAFDASGQNMTATLIGGAATPSWITGKIDGALSFDGTDDYATAPLTSLSASVTNLTVEFWAKTDAVDVGSVIMAVSDDNTNRLNIHLGYSGDMIYWDLGNIAGGGRLSTTFNPAWYGQWAHWAFVAKSGTGMSIYRNGLLIASNTTTSTFTKGTKTLEIGRIAGSASYWAGNIDNLKIYEAALTPAQIGYDYSQGGPLAYYSFDENSGTTVHSQTEQNGESGLVSWWKMDEGTGTTANNTTNSNNLTLYNAPTWGTGKTGTSLSLNGSTQYARVNSTIYDRSNGQELTVETWIYPQRLAGQYQDLVVNRSASLYNWMLYLHTTDGSVQLHGSAQNKSTYIPPLNTWTHIAATVDQNGMYKLYANGQLVQTVSGYTYNAAAPGELSVGNFGTTEYFQGSIDNVKIFNRALSAAEVVTDYSSLQGHFVGTPAWADGAQGNLNQKPLGKSLYFSGTTGQYIDIGDQAAFKQQAFSVSAWVKKDSGSCGPYNQCSILSKGSNGHVGFNFAMRNTGSAYKPEIRVNDDYMYLNGDTTIADNTWYFLTATVDGSYLRLYVNGKLDKEAANTQASISYDTTHVRIGNANNSADLPMKGWIDELKFYPYVIGTDQIMADYNRGAAQVLGVGTNDSDAGSSHLKAWWKFDEASGITTQDNSGNGNFLSMGIGNSAPSWDKGQYGNGLKFNGTTDYLTCTDATCGGTSKLDVSSNNWTMAAWAKSTATGYQMILEKAVTGSNSYDLLINTGTPVFRAIFYNTAGAAYCDVSGTKVVNDGKWHFVAGVLIQGTGCYVYTDGVLDGSSTSLSGTFNGDSTADLQIGRRFLGSSTQMLWTGSLDNIKVWATALTPAQIAYEYNQGKPMAEWRFDEKDGDVAHEDMKVMTTTNLMGNPSFETGITNWSANGATLLQTSDKSYSGNYSMNSAGAVGIDHYAQYSGHIPVTVGTTYTYSAQIYPVSVTSTYNLLRVIWYTAGDVYVSESVAGSVTAGMVNSWNNISGQFVPPATTAYAILRLNNNGTADLDAIQFEQSAFASPYCDGSLVGSGNSWSGTAHASTSTCRNAFDGQLVNFPTDNSQWTSAKINGGLTFDGSNDYVHVPKTVRVQAPLTISLWAKPDAGLTGIRAVYSSDANASSVIEYNYDTSKFTFNIITSNNGYSVNAASFTSDANWHHLVWQYDGAALKGYIDGKLAVNVAKTGTLPYHTYNDFSLGAYCVNYPCTAGSYFKGQLDEFKIYNYALTTDQVQVDYNNGAAVRF